MSGFLNKLLKGKINWQESYPSLILGAIIVVILGLLVANYLSKRGQEQIETGTQTEQTQVMETPTAGAEYVVKANNSLSKISEAAYGTQSYWPTLAAVNSIKNPNVLWVDTKLQLPPKEQLDAKKAELSATTYQVAAGDTFFTIAEKMYGDGSKWKVLHQANGSRYLPNGNPLVMSGSTITIPR